MEGVVADGRFAGGPRPLKPITLPPAPHPDPFSDPLSVAVVAEMVERGYPGLEVGDVTRRAGISSRDFHRRFADVDHCALDTYERGCADFQRRIGIPFNHHTDWQSGLRAAAYEAADWLVEHPHMARFGNTELLRMRSGMGQVRREELFEFLAELIDRGREAAPNPEALPEQAAMVAVGSVAQLFAHRLQRGTEVDIDGAVRESLYGVVSIYLGQEAAAVELAGAPR